MAYRPRRPRASPWYRLVEAHYDDVKGQWEERYERRYRFWRGFVDEQVRRYLDCGLFDNGFARIRCPDCHDEYLLAFSCKTRELCPSCAAKRSAATAAVLVEDVLEEVAHAQWVFVIPKMLRPYFLLMHIPEPRRHLTHYYGAYSNASRGRRRRQVEADAKSAEAPDQAACQPNTLPDERRLRRRWSQLIKRVYEVDPLECPSCGADMRVVAFILDHDVVDAILRHLERTGRHPERGPPVGRVLPAAAS